MRKGRLLLLGVFLAVVVTALYFWLNRAENGDQSKQVDSTSLVVASYGGAWQDAQKAAMFEPFARSAGVTVNDVVYDGQFAKLREMVSRKAVEWDVVDVEGNMVLLGGKEGLLEPIDYKVIPRDQLIEGSMHEYGIGIVAWSWVLAFRAGTLTEQQLSNPWKTYFDVKAVPGARGMRNDPRRNLEIALMADGVAPQKLYPLNVERAFKTLTKFRDDMKRGGFPIVWWDEYSKPPALLRDGEVVLTPAANGRVADAMKEGAPLGFAWANGIVDLDWWVVPKGTTKKDQAMQFIGYASQASAQAEIVKLIPYGPVNRQAFGLLDAKVARNLPTYEANLSQQIVFGTDWWASNLDRVQARWNDWRTGI